MNDKRLMTTMKFAVFAIVCLFAAPASAFAPASLSPQQHATTIKTTTSSISWTVGRRTSQLYSGDDAVALYGGGGSSISFGVDIDVDSFIVDDENKEGDYDDGNGEDKDEEEDIEDDNNVDCDGRDYREQEDLGEDSVSYYDYDGRDDIPASRRRLRDRDGGVDDGSSTKGSSQTTRPTNEQRDAFVLPEVSGQSHSLLATWTSGPTHPDEIEVVLVTQCSIDRLPNLQAQLAGWTGKSSVAVYLKPTENKSKAVQSIRSTLQKAKKIAGTKNKRFDAVVTLVEGCTQGEAYPINYLRNVALLEAQHQHLRFCPSLDTSASFLVDVDFWPSRNLHAMLHTPTAATSILKEGQVVVCPAFESKTTTPPTLLRSAFPSSILSLKKLVDNGEAEGFHLSNFPQGHGPTQFDTFWEKSLRTSSTDENGTYDLWKKSYVVQHQDLFEPYIVMASSDVPLYDERFQGYGLNKISHLASVAATTGEYRVLPGVFVVAPVHERSESWKIIYGQKTDNAETKRRNQSALRELYKDFLENLRNGLPPRVSKTTQARQQAIRKRIQREEQE